MADTLLSVWAVSFAFDASRYLVAAGAAFLFFRVFFEARFRHRLVQADYARAADVRRELAYSVSTALIFSAVGTVLVFGARAGIFRVYEDVGERGWAYFVLSLLALVVLHDAYFYWTHRAMHARRLFKLVHQVHHRSRSPSPWAAYSFSPIEALVQAAFVPLVTLVLPVHAVALFVFLGFMIVRNVVGHLGVELFPRGFATSRVFRWSTTTTHHAMHHRRFGSNYGLYFTLWDRLMGTTDPDYERSFDETVSRRR